MPCDFSNPIDQDIRTQCALSWKIVVSEWRSVIAVSLNIGGGVRLIKPAKLCMCMQTHYKHDEDRSTVLGVRGRSSVPLSHSGNVVTRIGHTHTPLFGLLYISSVVYFLVHDLHDTSLVKLTIQSTLNFSKLKLISNYWYLSENFTI